MLEAAPHRGRRCTVDTIGQVAVGINNDPDWRTASLARGDGRLVAFAGALDNRGELADELRRTGHPPAGAAAADVVLAAWDAWGPDAVGRLRGSFAGVVTDGATATLFRDHFGFRPLFVHDGPNGLYAATEIKQVVAGARLPREPDLDHLEGIVFGGITTSTAIRGVQRVPRGAVGTADGTPGTSFRRYWDAAAVLETSDLRGDEVLEGLRDALERATVRALTGRDAILLSGGLDSPALAGFAVRGVPDGPPPLTAVTAVYPSYPSVDESRWTRLVADDLGLPLHTYEARAGSLDDVDFWVDAVDGPVNVISLPEAAEGYRQVRAAGGRMAMTGELAEAVFHSQGYLLGHLLLHGRLGALRDHVAARRELGRRWPAIAREVGRAIAPTGLLRAYDRRRPRRRERIPTWLDRMRMLDVAADHRPPVGPAERWARGQVGGFEGPAIGLEADEIVAAHCGVDVRRPFGDVDLWEFVLSLPAEVKAPAGDRRTKPLLREAARGVIPDAIIDRRDKTFFDEFHDATADHERLTGLLCDSEARLPGVDYDLLVDRVRSRQMPIHELQWARDLGRVHAFLATC